MDRKSDRIMKPIYYKSKESGISYKVVMDDNITEKQIDACLDAIGYKNTEFITEEEFKKAHDSYVDMIIMDDKGSGRLGILTTGWDIDFEDENDLHLK
jgi:hypothetical protein